MSNQGPLSGITILDLTRVLSGPFCTMTLYNLGATVIKVEQPGKGDDSRAFGPFIDNESAYSNALNHGKKSIALNLKNEDDRTIFKKLVIKADVLVENFRPGVMERLGYSWENLHNINPKLIYACISGFGQTGPEALRACYDLVAQGMSGLMSITGEPDSLPMKSGFEIGDISAGIFTAIGINAALYQREQTGIGQCIGTSMLDCLVGMMFGAVSRHSATPQQGMKTGNRHATIAPFDTFQTKDKLITLCVANDRLFKKFCQVIDKPLVCDDERYASNRARIAHVDELKQLIEKVLSEKNADQWLNLFLENGIPAGPINSMEDVMAEPQLNFRNMINHFADDYMPGFSFPGNPIKFAGDNGSKEYPRGPKIDEHREEIIKLIEDIELTS